MNRIDKIFKTCDQQNRKALVAFVTAGDPNLETSEQLILKIAQAGADIIEIGVPFSDPMADGIAIQQASQRAITAGTNITKIIQMVTNLRKKIDTPLILFSYYNIILNYGVKQLAKQTAQAGIDGWLIVDLPLEEMQEVIPYLQQNKIHMINLIAPTTPTERIKKIVAHAQGFIYYITVTGVTGARTQNQLPTDLIQKLEAIRKITTLPIVAGFGISTPEMATNIAKHTDGVVVGSAMIKKMADAPTTKQGIQQCQNFAKSLAKALR